MPKRAKTREQRLKAALCQDVASRRACLDSAGTRNVKDEFLEKYCFCEIATKRILSEYHKAQGRRMSKVIRIDSVRASLRFFHVAVDNQTIDKMFKSEQKRGSRSARDLRDSIVHNLSIPDMKEVVDRKQELFLLMDGYLKELMRADY